MWAFRIASVAAVVGLCTVVALVARSVSVHVRTAPPAPASPPASSATASAPASTAAVAAQVDPDALKGAAFVGNSCVDVLHSYGIVPEADFFARTGLTVTEAFKKPVINGQVPVLEELKRDKRYTKVFLMFGENELGWSTDSAFTDGYAKVIQSVRASQPEAGIYVQSILPVSKAVSDKNEDNTNNARIDQFNEMLEDLCTEQQVTYVDVHSQFLQADGSLVDGISTDGIHFNKAGCQKWVDYLRASC